MYAVVKDGGHQFRAVPGEKVAIERRELSPGDEIVFEDVLAVVGEKTKLGSPLVAGAKVLGVVEAEAKGPKVRGARARENNSSRTRFGHRQKYTTVTIREIVAG